MAEGKVENYINNLVWGQNRKVFLIFYIKHFITISYTLAVTSQWRINSIRDRREIATQNKVATVVMQLTGRSSQIVYRPRQLSSFRIIYLLHQVIPVQINGANPH